MIHCAHSKLYSAFEFCVQYGVRVYVFTVHCTGAVGETFEGNTKLAREDALSD